MTDHIERRADTALETVKDRIGELDAEIGALAADTLETVATHALHRAFTGATRRVLCDRVVERLALEEMLKQRNEVIERLRESERKEQEHHERTVKPRLEAEARRAELKRQEESELATIAKVLDRVKATRPQREKPSAADVAFLRKHTIFSDRYNAPGSVVQLLAEIEQRPWWRE